MGNKIIIAGKEFEVETNVITWHEGKKWDSHSPNCINPTQTCVGGKPFSKKKPVNRNHRYSGRPQLRKYGRGIPPLEAAQGVIRQLILHHDGCRDAEMCFDVLHNERGLSCHFLIDNDGTIYQTLDLAFMGYHAAGFNAGSIGIEVSSKGDAKRWPGYYNKKDFKAAEKHDTATCKIHDHIYLAYDYTKGQYEAMQKLVRALARALPNMPIDYPQQSPGYQSWTEIAGAKSFAGLMGHYHTTRRKWDPGPFDFKEFCESIRGRLSFPVAFSAEPPDVPDDDDERAAKVAALYKANEEHNGGFFPVGPYGESRLWHGGVHIFGKGKDNVHAPFPGRLLVARMGGLPSDVGDTNFVLLRHDLRLGTEAMRFYSLYFHLADEWSNAAGERPAWMDEGSWEKKKKKGKTVLLDEPIEAGDIIGHLGKAGLPENRKAQLHLEMFANEDLSDILQTKFKLEDGAATGRIASDEFIAKIDADRNGILDRRELITYFTSPDRKLERIATTFHVSEWTEKPNWIDELARMPRFQGQRKSMIEKLFADQIKPTLWWTPEVAKHTKLPAEGVVYHYNPITLIKVINNQLQRAKHENPNGKNDFAVADAKEKPKDILGDIDDESGESFVDADELKDVIEPSDLQLEDLANGFPD